MRYVETDWQTQRNKRIVDYLIVSKMEERRRHEEESAPITGGYWRVVKVDLEDGTEFKNDDLFETREEAEASREECQKKWKDHAWDYREYLSMEYQLRFVNFEEVAEDKRQKLEKWHTYLRTTFLDPLDPATFKSCCQMLVVDMLQRVEKLSASDLSKMRHDGKQLYSPWQSYGGGAKIWAYMQPEPSSPKVSYWGMFAKDSMFGTIYQRIELFESIADFKEWLANTSKATEIFEKCMKEALDRNINSDELPQ